MPPPPHQLALCSVPCGLEHGPLRDLHGSLCSSCCERSEVAPCQPKIHSRPQTKQKEPSISPASQLWAGGTDLLMHI